MAQTEGSWKEILAFTLMGGVLWLIVKPSGDKQESKEEGKADKLAITNKTQSAFSEDFYIKLLTQEHYKNTSDYLTKISVSNAQLSHYVQTIYESKGWFNDDEDALYSVFRILKSITLVSIVAKSFNIKYNLNMYSYLSTFLNVKEMNRILEIINKKYYL